MILTIPLQELQLHDASFCYTLMGVENALSRPAQRDILSEKESAMKTIMIMTASIGAGHNQVAYAMRESLQENDPEAQVEVFDLLEERRVYQMVNSLYLETIQKAPGVFSKAYGWTQSHQTHPRVSSMLHHLCYLSLQRIQQQKRPDLFLFTHPFPVAAYHSKNLAPAYAILTDFGFHPLWSNPQMKGYFVSQPEQVGALKKLGLNEACIYLSGIPLGSGFRKESDSLSLTIPQKKVPHVLLMGGGLGIGGVERFVRMTEKIPTTIKMTAVTGRNHILRQELLNRTRHLSNWEVLGFSHEIARLMRQSSLLVTKAGAVTLSEAAACNLPTIILNPLPGHEEENAAQAVEQGWALRAHSAEEAYHLVRRLSNQRSQLQQMRFNASRWALPHAADFVSRQLQMLHPAERSRYSC